MSACLCQESQALDYAVVQIDELRFRQFVDVDYHDFPQLPMVLMLSNYSYQDAARTEAVR